MVIVYPYHRKGRARPWPISRRQSHPLHRTLTLTSLSVMVLVNEQTPCDVPTFASLPKARVRMVEGDSGVVCVNYLNSERCSDWAYRQRGLTTFVVFMYGFCFYWLVLCVRRN